MAQQTTTKIFVSVLLALVGTGCHILPPREVFIRRFTLAHPDNPHALFMEGKSYLVQGDWPKAAACFRAALHLQPNFEEARVGLGHAYRSGGYYRDAAAVYREVLAKSPRNVPALEGLGICEARLDRPDEAEKSFEKALAVEPKSVSTLDAYADYLYGQRQYGRALQLWEQSLRLNPNQSQLTDLVKDLRAYVAKYGPKQP